MRLCRYEAVVIWKEKGMEGAAFITALLLREVEESGRI